MTGFFLEPWHDLMAGLERTLHSGRSIVLMLLGLVVGWWLYVPIHELLHVAGCIVTGGEVDRLEIAPLYGGHLWASVFPFVVADGDYAGRLSGFDTGGSDLVYLATDFAPYLLTIWPGVWAWRRARSAFGFGFWFPVALAPFVSLTGDAFEIGSILVTQVPPWTGDAAVLRSDDVFRLVGELAQVPSAPWLGVALAFVVGAIWAWATYGLGHWLAARSDASAAETAG